MYSGLLSKAEPGVGRTNGSGPTVVAIIFLAAQRQQIDGQLGDSGDHRREQIIVLGAMSWLGVIPMISRPKIVGVEGALKR